MFNKLKKSMNKFFIKLLLGFIIIISTAQAQSPDINLKKYWNYRDKFQKHFVKLGKNPGNGINISNIDNVPGNVDNGGFGWANTTPVGGAPTLHGYKRVGDAMVLQGEYIGVLATQYRLLKDAGKDVLPTLNELYYSMEAINRIDRSAEQYFGAAFPSLNGFFLRDDVPKLLTNDWNNQYIKTDEPRDLYEGISSDFYQDNDPAPGNIRNEESQDQMIGIMMGLAYVVKLVDASEFVKPTASDAGFNIVSEAKAITSRLMNHLIQLNVLYDNTELSELNAGHCDVTANWVITNPTTGKKVGDASNRSEPRPYSYGFAKAAEKITGNSYTPFNIIHKADEILFDGHLCIAPHNVIIPLNDINTLFWNTFENANIGPADFVTTIPGFSFSYSYPSIPPTVPPTIQTSTIGWDAFKLTIDNKLEDFNVNLALSLATIGDSWTHDNINRWGDTWNMWIFDLAYSVLHNATPKHTKAFYEAILDTAPNDCYGPHNFNPASGPQNPFLYSSGWFENSRWGHPFDPSSFTRGEYNGNDYMLLYNLYQLAFKSSGTLPTYSDISCPCESAKRIQLNSTGSILSTNITLQRKFSEYLDFDVRLKEYLIENLSVESGKQLNVETDLIVCHNIPGGSSTLLTQSNGIISVGNTTGLKSSIVVRKGNALRIGNNGTVKVYDNSSILIEEGATLIIDQGATLQLLGNNAVLEIKGDLKLNPNAVFTFTHPGVNSGYIKFSRETPWDNLPHVIGSTGCSIDLKGQNKNDKILEIAQDILWISQFQNISLFKIQTGKVEFTYPGKSYISTDAPTSFIADKFISTGTSDGRVAVWGQPVCQITNCLFDKVPVEGYLFMYGNKLSMSYTEIKNCNTAGLGTQGMGVNLFNTNFNSNETGMNSQLFTQNSTITGAKFNDNEYGASIWASPVEVLFTTCKIKNNFNFGVDLIGPTRAKVKCGEVTKNFIGFNVTRTASLSMNTTLGGGYVDAQNNLENTILLDYAAGLDINNGYNDLRVNTGGTAPYPNNVYTLSYCTNFAICPVEIAGTLKHLPSLPVIANNNKWQPAFGGTYPSLVAASSEDKFTEVFSTFAPGTQLHFTDVAQSERAPCGFWDPAPCPTCPASFLEVCPTCNTINTPAFINIKTNAAVKEAMSNMDLTITNGHKQAVDKFHQVLKYPILAPTEGDKFVTNIAEREMMVSLAQSIESNQVFVSDSTISLEVLKAIEIQDDKIIQATIDNKYLDKLYGNIEKALINYVAQHRVEAIAILDNVLTFVQPSEQEYVTYIRCLINNEQLLMSKQINQVEFLNSVSLCTPPSRGTLRTSTFLPDAISEEETDEYNISLFPNPSSNQLFLKYDLSEQELATFIIYDVTGKILFEKTLKGGSRTEEIADLQLSNGIYLYKIISSDNNILKQSKLTIIK